MKLTFRQHLITSVVCTTIIAIIVACAGNGNVMIGGNPTPTPVVGGSNAFTAFVSHNSRPGMHSHVFQPGKSPVLVAALFQTTPSPSDIPESFETSCDIGSSLLAITPSGSIIPLLGDQTGQCTSFVSGPQPGGGNGLLKNAQPAFHAGTAEKLVVTGRSANGSQIRCADITATAAVADGDFLVPYFRPSDNNVLLFNGTTQLSFSCAVNVPAGDTVAHLTARWTKV